jgi:hypothetical protein
VKEDRFNPYKKFHGCFVPNWLLRRAEIGHGAKLTYARLCQYAGRDGRCYPSQRTLARELGVSDRSVRDYLGELETNGLVERERRGLSHTDRYHFLEHPWMDEQAGNPSTPERKDPAAPERKDPASQERQDPAERRESGQETPREENPERTNEEVVRSPERAPSNDRNGEEPLSEAASKGVLTEDAVVVDDPGDLAVGQSGPGLLLGQSDPDDAGQTAAVEPVERAPDAVGARPDLPTPDEALGYWQGRIQDCTYLVELFQRYVAHVHPEVRIRTRMEFDLQNAERLVAAFRRAIADDSRQPSSRLIDLIFWFVEHRIHSDRDATINSVTKAVFDWRTSGDASTSRQASAFLEAERRRLADAIRREKEADGRRSEEAERAEEERRRRDRRGKVHSACVEHLRRRRPGVDITPDDDATDALVEELRKRADQQRLLKEFCYWYYERHLRHRQVERLDMREVASRFPEFADRWFGPCDEAWRRYVTLMGEAFPRWGSDRYVSMHEEFAVFHAMLTAETGDRWELLAEFVRWCRADWDGDRSHLPLPSGQWVDSSFERFLLGRSTGVLESPVR